jgi:LuxR family maltose regulon positive regulatory protein
MGEYGRFTAHKERRGATREYWKAYRHRGGRLYRAYLGKSAELTLDRLNAVAAELAGGMVRAVLTPDIVSLDRMQCTTETIADFQPRPLHPTTQRSRRNIPDDAQTLHLLTTKLAIPVSHPSLVSRPRLVERLDGAICQGQKLTLISAPAGFGKTTLLAEWLRENDERGAINDQESQTLPHRSAFITHRFSVAWLSLDDNDNDLGQFLAYLIAALESVRLGSNADAMSLLRSRAAEPPVHAILTTLVNAVTDPADPLVLVLDDYHTISLLAIHEAVAFLLDRMPPQMHIVMTTRADPPVPLARLRARALLAEVRAADLRFTHDETTDLFDRVHSIH